GFKVVAGTRAGGGREEAGGHQPAQEFLPLNGDEVAQDLLSPMNVIRDRADVQTLEQVFRNACTRISEYGNISHGHSFCSIPLYPFSWEFDCKNEPLSHWRVQGVLPRIPRNNANFC